MQGICLKHVSKTLKGRIVLDDVCAQMEQGKIYGLFGRNGSGKTMLIRVIAGLLIPDEGSVEVFGKTLGKDAAFPESLGLTIENIGFWPNYTGFECLKILASIKKRISDDEIRGAMIRVGLNPADKRLYRQYSLGMRQKLAIAQAIMEKPELILLDEPTNSLDEETVVSVRNLLIEERERGALIVIASHNKEDLSVLTDAVFRVQEGVLKCES